MVAVRECCEPVRAGLKASVAGNEGKFKYGMLRATLRTVAESAGGHELREGWIYRRRARTPSPTKAWFT
jgi:hypothetical protein